MVTVQVVPEPEGEGGSHPVQLLKSTTAFAVRVTTVPVLNAAEHVDPQSIPAGLDVTVPPSRPVFDTLNITLTVNALALTPVPAGVVTLSSPVVDPVGTVA